MFKALVNALVLTGILDPCALASALVGSETGLALVSECAKMAPLGLDNVSALRGTMARHVNRFVQVDSTTFAT